MLTAHPSSILIARSSNWISHSMPCICSSLSLMCLQLLCCLCRLLFRIGGVQLSWSNSSWLFELLCPWMDVVPSSVCILSTSAYHMNSYVFYCITRCLGVVRACWSVTVVFLILFPRWRTMFVNTFRGVVSVSANNIPYDCLALFLNLLYWIILLRLSFLFENYKNTRDYIWKDGGIWNPRGILCLPVH